MSQHPTRTNKQIEQTKQLYSRGTMALVGKRANLKKGKGKIMEQKQLTIEQKTFLLNVFNYLNTTYEFQGFAIVDSYEYWGKEWIYFNKEEEDQVQALAERIAKYNKEDATKVAKFFLDKIINNNKNLQDEDFSSLYYNKQTGDIAFFECQDIHDRAFENQEFKIWFILNIKECMEKTNESVCFELLDNDLCTLIESFLRVCETL